ncbi:MAG: DNA repair exonuclease [Ruminococcus sp.]|nr:DNA repair exonuclease [Ruminococcus sp.]
MKLIHCADLHLDSKLNANLDKEHAKERKGEILHTFERMVSYAAEHGVEAILVAGDLFDVKNISATARNTVLHNVTNHPEIMFYYLKGNHDNDNFLSRLEEIPANLKLFGPGWTTYEAAGGQVAISGLELSAENANLAHASLVLDTRKFNIVMLHGQESRGAARDKAEVIDLKALRNKGIDYLALGHVHAYKKEKLDARGTYCYAGCLEGRGFDECGEHGFVLLDIDTENLSRHSHRFVPFARRKLHEVHVDVTDCAATAEMADRAKEELARAGCGAQDLVKIVLEGMLDVECEKDLAYFLSVFRPQFYFVKAYDETTLKISMEDYLLDESLKGEYVRQVMADGSLSDEEKKIIVRYGLQAIAGEEVQ